MQPDVRLEHRRDAHKALGARYSSSARAVALAPRQVTQVQAGEAEHIERHEHHGGRSAAPPRFAGGHEPAEAIEPAAHASASDRFEADELPVEHGVGRQGRQSGIQRLRSAVVAAAVSRPQARPVSSDVGEHAPAVELRLKDPVGAGRVVRPGVASIGGTGPSSSPQAAYAESL